MSGKIPSILIRSHCYSSACNCEFYHFGSLGLTGYQSEPACQFPNTRLVVIYVISTYSRNCLNILYQLKPIWYKNPRAGRMKTQPGNFSKRIETLQPLLRQFTVAPPHPQLQRRAPATTRPNLLTRSQPLGGYHNADRWSGIAGNNS